jgi:hypothetical protein
VRPGLHLFRASDCSPMLDGGAAIETALPPYNMSFL